MEEVCGKSIPQKEAGGKGLSASKVRSPTVFSGSGLTCLDSPPGGAGVAALPKIQKSEKLVRSPAMHIRRRIGVYRGVGCSTVL